MAYRWIERFSLTCCLFLLKLFQALQFLSYLHCFVTDVHGDRRWTQILLFFYSHREKAIRQLISIVNIWHRKVTYHGFDAAVLVMWIMLVFQFVDTLFLGEIVFDRIIDNFFERNVVVRTLDLVHCCVQVSDLLLVKQTFIYGGKLLVLIFILFSKAIVAWLEILIRILA